jgi:ubiquitin-protein ligase E3 D
VRLPVGESDKETVDGFSSFSQTSPKELRVDSYSTLGCRGCKAVLMEKSPVDKVLPLPSENWREMFDFWGAGIGSFEHIPREGIFAHECRVFVGEATIIVHEKDLQDPAVLTAAKDISIHAKDDEEQPDWVQVSCSACTIVLGERRTENPTTLRLQKHLITAASLESPALNVFERYTIDSTISAQMLHIAESDGVFRFRLQAPSDGHEEPAFSGLQLQLMSWDARIRASKLSSCATEFQRVLKVVYSSAAPPAAAAVSPVLPVQAALPPMVRVHELSVTRAVGGEILRRLKQSTLLLPASQRTFNKMAVGYLFA